MKFRGTGSGRLVLAGVALVALATRSEAQVAGGFGPGGMVIPQITPQGDWAEVLTVTPRWLVLQNRQGQQFPVSLDAVQEFLMRWPTAPDRLAPDAWVEAFGAIRFSNQIVTDHVDVFQGTSKSMVTLMRVPIDGSGQILTPARVDTQSNYGDDFQVAGQDKQPRWLYVAGPVVNRNPLIVATTDNTPVTMFGPQGFPPMTLLTRGSATLVQPGDEVWYDTIAFGPRSLSLSQLMVYKTVPFNP
jgi:hypothetical protein